MASSHPNQRSRRISSASAIRCSSVVDEVVASTVVVISATVVVGSVLVVMARGPVEVVGGSPRESLNNTQASKPARAPTGATPARIRHRLIPFRPYTAVGRSGTAPSASVFARRRGSPAEIPVTVRGLTWRMQSETTQSNNGTMPAIYLGHGAPPLLDDAQWMGELATWAKGLPKPKSILIVSAHWESAPLAFSSIETGTPLVYDFYGFPARYYQFQYPAPGAAELAAKVAGLMPDTEHVAFTSRGLDHGAWVPLMAMYPQADIPVLQVSMPSLDPGRLLEMGRRLRPLRDEGVLIVGSGFLTHGLPFLHDFRVDAP